MRAAGLGHLRSGVERDDGQDTTLLRQGEDPDHSKRRGSVEDRSLANALANEPIPYALTREGRTHRGLLEVAVRF